MPIFSTKAGGLSCSGKLKEGSYYSTSIEIEYNLRKKNSIKVGIGRAGLLDMNSEKIIYTDSLGSCFPVVFIFQNGDIGLYHSNKGGLGSVDKINYLLDREDLFEIQIFKKIGIKNTEAKVDAFLNNLADYYQDKAPPRINVASIPRKHNHDSVYEIIACYKLVNHNPLIVIGMSSPNNAIDEKIKNRGIVEDDIQPCVFKLFNEASVKWSPGLYQPAVPNKRIPQEKSWSCVIL